MKSKITIDLDEDNQPIIKVDYFYSEDVRDKMVKKFLETFGGDSSWANFKYLAGGGEYNNTTAILRPIPKEEFRIEGIKLTRAHIDLYGEVNEEELVDSNDSKEMKKN